MGEQSPSSSSNHSWSYRLGTEVKWFVKNTFVVIDDDSSSPRDTLRRSSSENGLCSGSSVASSEVAQELAPLSLHQLWGSSTINYPTTGASDASPQGAGDLPGQPVVFGMSSVWDASDDDDDDEEVCQEPAPVVGHAATCRCQKKPRIKPCGYFYSRHGCSQGDNCTFCHHARHCQQKKARPNRSTRNDVLTLLDNLPNNPHIAAKLYGQMLESYPDLKMWMESKLRTTERSDIPTIMKLAKKMKKAQSNSHSDRTKTGGPKDQLSRGSTQEDKAVPTYVTYPNQKTTISS